MYSQRELDDLVYNWHMDDMLTMPLSEYLGWTPDEYAHFVRTSEQPRGTTTTD